MLWTILLYLPDLLYIPFSVYSIGKPHIEPV